MVVTRVTAAVADRVDDLTYAAHRAHGIIDIVRAIGSSQYHSQVCQRVNARPVLSLCKHAAAALFPCDINVIGTAASPGHLQPPTLGPLSSRLCGGGGRVARVGERPTRLRDRLSERHRVPCMAAQRSCCSSTALLLRCMHHQHQHHPRCASLSCYSPASERPSHSSILSFQSFAVQARGDDIGWTVLRCWSRGELRVLQQRLRSDVGLNAPVPVSFPLSRSLDGKLPPPVPAMETPSPIRRALHLHGRLHLLHRPLRLRRPRLFRPSQARLHRREDDARDLRSRL